MGVLDLTVGGKLIEAIPHIEYQHVMNHVGKAFRLYYSVTTAATNGHRTALIFTTPATGYINALFGVSSSVACTAELLETPTIAANTGSHGNTVYNRNRPSTITSGILDNATSPAVNKFTTLTEAQIAGDGTWNKGTVIATFGTVALAAPAIFGLSQRWVDAEWILKQSTKYVVMLTNTSASANIHRLFVEYYEASL
jgi:hypothetical protein